MSDKFGRNYKLTVTGSTGNQLAITLPFTIEFDITRNTLSSANVCQVRIYNLSQAHRNQMRFNSSDYGTFRPIQLEAGYGNKTPVIFTGNISQAWSVREGVNFITQIECYDGGFAFITGQTNTSFPAGTPNQTVIETMAGTLPNVKVGTIGSYPGTLPKGASYSGNTAEQLTELTGGGFFVDQGYANALGTNEYIIDGNGILQITSATGLLQTPILEQTIVHADMIFEPSLNCGSLISLKSSTESNFNGDYKVTGVKHRGMISAAVCGSVITTAEFFYSKLLSGVS